jgi:hypothetical protein
MSAYNKVCFGRLSALRNTTGYHYALHFTCICRSKTRGLPSQIWDEDKHSWRDYADELNTKFSKLTTVPRQHQWHRFDVVI